MTAPLLAAVLIVKDEEGNLPGCLDSLACLRPLLSEVVVYDTGSSDRTPEIAEHFGARVERGYWDDDFARARNDAAALTHAKWALSIDADERVVAHVPRLRQMLQNALTVGLTGADALDVTILDVDSNGFPIAQHPFSKLFRPSRVRWASPIHETLVAQQEGRPMATAEMPRDVLHLRHYGYANAATRTRKAGRNADVARTGRAAIEPESTPDRRAKLMIDEARALVAADQVDLARELFDQALALAEVSPERRVTVLHEAVGFHVLDRQFDRAAAELAELEGLGVPKDAVTWLRATLLVDSGRPREAMQLLRALKTVRLSTTVELDGSYAVALLMRAAVDAGEFDEALACAIQLVGSTGDVEKYGPQMLRLWGDQPPTCLAQLLSEVVGDRRPQVLAGLERLGGVGPRVARAMSDVVPLRKSRAGAAFGS